MSLSLIEQANLYHSPASSLSKLVKVLSADAVDLRLDAMQKAWAVGVEREKEAVARWLTGQTATLEVKPWAKS